MTKLFIFLLLYNTLPAQAYTLETLVAKKDIFLGESVAMTLRFKYKDAEDYELGAVKIENAKVEELDFTEYQESKTSFVEETYYRLTPLQAGVLKIAPFTMNIERLTSDYKNFDNKSKYTQHLSIHSQSITLNVQALPKGIDVLGEYTLTASVDKRSLQKGEILTLTLSLQGLGHVTNLDALTLDIPNTNSYLVMSAKSTQHHLLSKTYEIMAEKSFRIPTFELHYFDKSLNIIRTTRSEAYTINVIDKDILNNHTNKWLQPYTIIFILTFLLMVFVFIFIFYKRKRVTNKKRDFIQTVKKTKSQNQLYKILVVHLGKDKVLDDLIFLLESKDTTNYKQLKKAVIKLLLG